MQRRTFLLYFSASAVAALPRMHVLAVEALASWPDRIVPYRLSDRAWQQKLTPLQYRILRRADTERPFSHPLNDEKRQGEYRCAGCGLTLFTSAMKYDSGTGWPSFYRVVERHIETQLDFKLIWPRTEYHCKRCQGHQGHVFNDGPQPTGKRWCNNGAALRFVVNPDIAN